MKRTTQTISWILVLSALTVAACGDRSESHTRIRKGDGGGLALQDQFNEKLPNANKDLAGYWIEETQPSSDQHVTRISFWKIDLEKNLLSANMLCEAEGSLKGVVANGLSKIQVNAEQLVLRDPQVNSAPLDSAGPDSAKIDCMLSEKKASLTYKQDGDHLEVLDQANQPTRKFCRATWDEKHQRPLPSEACAKTNDSTPVVEKTQLPEVIDLTETESAEAKATLKAEGEVSDKILTPATRWTQTSPEQDGISSFLTMDLQKSTDGDLLILSKTCYFTKDIDASRVDIQVNPKAIFTGKAIRTIEEKTFKVTAKGKKPACALSASKKTIPYILADDKLTLNLDSGPLSFIKVKNTTETLTKK